MIEKQKKTKPMLFVIFLFVLTFIMCAQIDAYYVNYCPEYVLNAQEQAPIYLETPLGFQLTRHLENECEKYNVPIDFALAIMWEESRMNLDLVDGNDVGVMQINKMAVNWLKENGFKDIDRYDYYKNITYGVAIIAGKISSFGDLHMSLMAYNCGNGGAKNLWNKGIYESKYSRKVINTMNLIKNNMPFIRMDIFNLE